METTNELTKFEDTPCCPPLDTEPVCDVIVIRRQESAGRKSKTSVHV